MSAVKHNWKCDVDRENGEFDIFDIEKISEQLYDIKMKVQYYLSLFYCAKADFR